MSKLKLNLNNGRVIEFTSSDYNSEEIVVQFNDPNILFTGVGGSIVNKHAIVSILPTYEEREYIYEYELALSDGRKEVLKSDEIIDVNDAIILLNNPNTLFISIGGAVVQKHYFQTLLLINMNEELEENEAV